MTTYKWHKNLDLAREMVTYVIIGIHSPAIENAEIIERLDGGDEFELTPLPGDSLDAVIENLKQIVLLASEPLFIPTAGRDKSIKRFQASHQRENLLQIARVCLALLEVDNADCAGD